MNIFDSYSTPSHVLNGHIAKELFSIAPEQGVIIAIADETSGKFWSSNDFGFRQVLSDRRKLEQMFARVDDGCDHVLAQISDFAVAVSQLSTKHTNCGYIVIALEKTNCQSALLRMELIEMIIGQANLIAGLIETNNTLYCHELEHICADTAESYID
ncbi:MAG: hypothetical protein KAS23_00735 [Anaerohalosphaera sp.]|nr:hypothetical protein [Anaerohalosphaera sp.]